MLHYTYGVYSIRQSEYYDRKEKVALEGVCNAISQFSHVELISR